MHRSLRLILVVGSVMDFVGPSPAAGSGRPIRPVDGMIMSTNIGLNFDANNPMIQKSFRERLAPNVQEAIRGVFKEKGRLADFRDALVVRVRQASCPEPLGSW